MSEELPTADEAAYRNIVDECRSAFKKHIQNLRDRTTVMAALLKNIERDLDEDRYEKAMGRFMCSVGFENAAINEEIQHAIAPASTIWTAVYHPYKAE